ncbi:hypothetical protein A2Y85_07215 [candidate division WOR-3 bacterium RBG_13_43_14]|uniref:Uncharacterized protein n=1 Tax=candidate division WOR-3 bacterium RBG_13_43_14 TaxID=1802590 RepID=A0A1F4UE02_UNCW3|nr:MAG: hypothetical protein A2Y85_07215 [candidate division WOR-3 bacterium RBG_13_43_14]
MPNKVVVRYLDGRIERGSTADFMPHKDLFHIVVEEDKDHKAIPVKMTNLKAVFFVKELGGKNRERPVSKISFEDIKDKKLIGRKVKVIFIDGEELLGLTLGYSPQRRGFFFTPIDSESNNERVFAVMSAVKDISFYD